MLTSILLLEKDTLMVMILDPTPACDVHATQIAAELRRQGGLLDHKQIDIKHVSGEYEMPMPAHLLQDFLQMQQTGRASPTITEWLQKVR